MCFLLKIIWCVTMKGITWLYRTVSCLFLDDWDLWPKSILAAHKTKKQNQDHFAFTGYFFFTCTVTLNMNSVSMKFSLLLSFLSHISYFISSSSPLLFVSLLCRDDLDVGVARFIQPAHLNPHVVPGGAGSKMPGPAGDHLLSHLLRLESAVAAGDALPAQRAAPSNTSRSKSSRIEALKATATSLSNRIEHEAQKLAGDDINYGAKTTVRLDTVLAPPTSHANLEDGSWVQAGLVESGDASLSSIQRILTSTGHSLHNGTALQGSGDLHPFRGQEEMNRTCANLTNEPTNSAAVAAPGPSSERHERRKLVNGFERPESEKHGLTVEKNQTDAHDSSAGSISEGPILSEGSFSEGDASPPHFSSSHPPPAHHLSAGDSCAAQMKDRQRLSDFQKEASRCPAISSPFTQNNGKQAWEELNKGSPLSVINIFTKNLHGSTKGPFS